MFVLVSSQGKMSKDGSDPAQTARSSGSASAAKSSSRGGLASVARLVKLGRCKNVLVVAGAGISTASGIPDFRLASVGLFSLYILNRSISLGLYFAIII